MTSRSWASRTLLSFSGWDEREGGERRSVRGAEVLLDGRGEEVSKSEDMSIITEGAMAQVLYDPTHS